MSESPNRRRWWSFALRGLLVVMMLLCIWLGVAFSRAQQQRSFIASLRKNNYDPDLSLFFDYQMDRSQPDAVRVEPVALHPIEQLPQFLQNTIYPELLTRIAGFGFGPFSGDAPVPDEIIDAACNLPALEIILINELVSDQQAAKLKAAHPNAQWMDSMAGKRGKPVD